MTKEQIETTVANYYTGKIQQHGATNLGVDWSTEESQLLRFEQLSKVITAEADFSITDLGCGYGAYLSYLDIHFKKFKYLGLDISDAMIEAAKVKYDENAHASFQCASGFPVDADYCIASGIFNVMLKTDCDAWKDYILTTLHDMDKHAHKGFAFNCLTKYSDKEYMQDYLYYADPLYLFDYCKKHFSKNVALLHDYQLYEFTIIVRKEHE